MNDSLYNFVKQHNLPCGANECLCLIANCHYTGSLNNRIVLSPSVIELAQYLSCLKLLHNTRSVLEAELFELSYIGENR